MLDTTIDPQRGTRKAVEPRGFIDCDIHQHFRNGLYDLAPYLDEAWQQRLGVQTLSKTSKEWQVGIPAARMGLPQNEFYRPPGGVMRRDSMPPDGGPPASSPAFVAEQLLDPHGVKRALLVGGNVLSLSALPNPDVAIAISRAYNEWMRDNWLAADKRFVGAALVTIHDPAAAAAEIERVKSWPGIAAVLLSPNRTLMGERHYYPIYEAASAAELPLIVHPQGTEGIYAGAPSVAGGIPTYYYEFKHIRHHIAEANSNSLVLHGVFERFPKLKVAFVEFGFLWLLENMWQLDNSWKALREETPWLKRLPSEYILDHIRVTTQPFPEPPNRQHLNTLIEIMHGDRLLMSASDYPHWDFDDPIKVLKALPPEVERKICIDNPLGFFGKRLNL